VVGPEEIPDERRVRPRSRPARGSCHRPSMWLNHDVTQITSMSPSPIT
jgi:hypothetical protein